MNIILADQLPLESPDSVAAQVAQEAAAAFIDTEPHSFNTTNLHTHGMHVSPVGNSDNVLLAIPPQSTQPYEIKVPATHTRGTYWYHAHTHGSTRLGGSLNILLFQKGVSNAVTVLMGIRLGSLGAPVPT